MKWDLQVEVSVFRSGSLFTVRVIRCSDCPSFSGLVTENIVRENCTFCCGCAADRDAVRRAPFASVDANLNEDMVQKVGNEGCFCESALTLLSPRAGQK